MEYNTKMKRLVLPEYGRNIQNMVDHCLTIEDREERTRCARSIIATMGNLFPHLRDINDFKNLLWDHLAIMSDYKLDIDYPYEITPQEQLLTKPDRLNYSSPKKIRFMHYGKTIQILIDKAVEMEQDDKRAQLEMLIANYMKKCYIMYNKDGVDDRKIMDDLAYLSSGRILMDPEIRLADFKDIPMQEKSSKKKKKKK